MLRGTASAGSSAGGQGPSLFGQDWLTKIWLDWGAINTVKCRTLTNVLESYSSVFEPGLGTLQGYKAKIYVDPGAQPKYCKARSAPYTMRGKVEEELERIVSEGISSSLFSLLIGQLQLCPLRCIKARVEDKSRSFP